jgi:hypothetical protein
MQFNPRPENKKSPEEGEIKKERFAVIKKWLKRAIVFGGLSMATYAAEQKYNLKDYSDYASFNEAFSHARRDGERGFYWNGNRYTTELVSKETSDLYFESKQFLSDYYRSDYFRNKLATAADSVAIADELKQTLAPDRLESLLAEINASGNNDTATLEELYATSEFQAALRARTDSIGEGYESRLHEKGYLSLTEERGNREDDGEYIPGSKHLFIYQDKSGGKENTTATHELAHKSSEGTDAMPFELLMLIAERTHTSLSEHVGPSYFNKYQGHMLAYLESPTEIDARQNAARFWLYKNYPGYKPDTPFEERHFDFLMERYDALPYDIQQLLDMFPDKKYFTENMNLF